MVRVMFEVHQLILEWFALIEWTDVPIDELLHLTDILKWDEDWIVDILVI